MLDKTFKQVFALLDYCYFLTKNDWLSVVLGQLNWTLWSDGIPADLATYEDCVAIISEIPEADIRQKAIYFVEKYSKQYSIFPINGVIDVLQGLSEDTINALIASVE